MPKRPEFALRPFFMEREKEVILRYTLRLTWFIKVNGTSADFCRIAFRTLETPEIFGINLSN